MLLHVCFYLFLQVTGDEDELFDIEAVELVDHVVHHGSSGNPQQWLGYIIGQGK